MTTDKLTIILLAILSCAWLGDFIKGTFDRKKIKADANLSDANAVQVLVGSAAAVVAPLKSRVEELQIELTEAKEQVDKLIEQLQKATAENQKVVTENQRITAENKRVTDENRRLRLIIGGTP
jgi:transcription antitermination factor NusA-like protein